MSFIANILSQIKQPSKKKEVHPQLEQMLKQKSKKKSGRKKFIIFLIIALIYFSIAMGMTFFFKQETQDIKSAVSLIKNRSTQPSIANLPLKGKDNDTPSPEDMAEIDKNVNSAISSIQNQRSNPPLQIQGNANNPQNKSEAIDGNLKDILSVVTEITKNQSIDTKAIKKNVSQDITKKNDDLTKMPHHKSSKPSNRFRQQLNNHEMLDAQDDIYQSEKEDDREMEVRVKKDGDTKSYSIDTVPPISGRHLYAGINLEKQGEYHDAFNEYKLSSITDGVSYRLLNRMAFVLIKTHRYAEAVEYAQMAIKLKEDYTPAIINLAIAYAKSNHYDLALETFENGLKLSPYDNELLYNLAVFHEKNNSLDSAHSLYTRLVEIGDKRGNIGLERIELLTKEQK
ncbi:MAG: hypothetical protein HQK91_13660 [Nitrospirae bacterium]|nr:hypothetical protein [Nitrospirota bacterium]